MYFLRTRFKPVFTGIVIYHPTYTDGVSEIAFLIAFTFEILLITLDNKNFFRVAENIRANSWYIMCPEAENEVINIVSLTLVFEKRHWSMHLIQYFINLSMIYQLCCSVRTINLYQAFQERDNLCLWQFEQCHCIIRTFRYDTIHKTLSGYMSFDL